MNAKFSEEEIRRFWTEQAKKHGTHPAASWSDVLMIDKEITEIVARFQDGDRILDVGCANGYSTLKYAELANIHIRGIDYIPEMIASAKKRAQDNPEMIRGTVEFEVGDIRTLGEQSGIYDKVLGTRVLINLQSWELQKKAVHELARVLRVGGLLLLSEATVQGWCQLNKFRLEWGLDVLPVPPFNLYLDERDIVDELSGYLELVSLENFSSTYFVGTRVLKPLLIKLLDPSIDVSNPYSEWNRWFASLPSFGDYGTQKLFVFRKVRESPVLRST